MSQLEKALGLDAKTHQRIQSVWVEFFEKMGISDASTAAIMRDLMLERRDVPQPFMPPGYVLVGFGPPANDWKIERVEIGQEADRLAREKDPLDALEAREWLDGALHRWLAELQGQIGVIWGDNAAQYFEGIDGWNGILAELSAYVEHEEQRMREEEAIDPGVPNFDYPWTRDHSNTEAHRMRTWIQANLPFLTGQVESDNSVTLWPQNTVRYPGHWLAVVPGEAVALYREEDLVDDEITSWRELHAALSEEAQRIRDAN